MQISFTIYPAYKVNHIGNEAPTYVDLWELFPKKYQVYIKSNMVTQYLTFLNLEKNKETIAKKLIKQLSDPIISQLTVFKPTTPYVKYQEEVDKFISDLDMNMDVYPMLYKRPELKNSWVGPNKATDEIVMVSDYNITFDFADFAISDDMDSVQSTVKVLTQVAIEKVHENELPDLKNEMLNDKDFLTELIRESLKG